MTRSQRSHSLLGKLDLFPLKGFFIVAPKVHGHGLHDLEKGGGHLLGLDCQTVAHLLDAIDMHAIKLHSGWSQIPHGLQASLCVSLSN
jgi:hypothetical protein